MHGGVICSDFSYLWENKLHKLLYKGVGSACPKKLIWIVTVHGIIHGPLILKLPIHLNIQWWKSPTEFNLSWKDEPKKRLEQQLADIVVTMIVAGEMHYRHVANANREYLIKQRDRLIEDIRGELISLHFAY